MEQYAYIQSFNKRAAHRQADHGIKTIWLFPQKIFTVIISPGKTLNVRNIVS